MTMGWSSLFCVLVSIAYVAASTSYGSVPPDYSTNVCYPGVGCFSNAYPFNNTGAVPLAPEFVGTEFRLYTRETVMSEVLEVGDRRSLVESSFNADFPTKIIIHGFLATGSLSWIQQLTVEFLRKEPMNVIVVDWGRGSGFPYVQAAANTRLVGAEIGNLILFLCYETEDHPRDYHLIGHSLGAHISGYAGHRCPGIGRITGLDPAQPNFQNQAPIVRLDAEDARFVDVIHTDGSPFEELGGFGMSEAVGHIDFYPNGGVQQPGCPQDGWSSFVSSAYRVGVQGAEDDVGCNHNRATWLFVESVNSQCPFTAYPCPSIEDFSRGNCFHCNMPSCPSMGYRASASAATGKFYLFTNPDSPYCGYHYLIELELGEDMTTEQGLVIVRLYGTRGHSDAIQLYSGNLNRGSILKGVLISGSSIGEVQDVHVTFQRSRGYLEYMNWFWNRDHEIHVQKLITMAAWTQERKIFCPQPDRIRSGGSLWLTRGTDEINSMC